MESTQKYLSMFNDPLRKGTVAKESRFFLSLQTYGDTRLNCLSKVQEDQGEVILVVKWLWIRNWKQKLTNTHFFMSKKVPLEYICAS